METLTSELRKDDPRVRAFRATDAFAVEAYRAAAAMRPGGLADEIRRTAIAAGGALVAAAATDCGGDDEKRQVDRARTALTEARYYLYLARRFGLLDARSYRALTLRQDAALRELDSGGTLRARRPP